MSNNEDEDPHIVPLPANHPLLKALGLTQPTPEEIELRARRVQAHQEADTSAKEADALSEQVHFELQQRLMTDHDITCRVGNSVLSRFVALENAIMENIQPLGNNLAIILLEAVIRRSTAALNHNRRCAEITTRLLPELIHSEPAHVAGDHESKPDETGD